MNEQTLYEAHIACSKGNLVHLKQLVLDGFNPIDEGLDEGLSWCLLYAVGGGHLAIIEFLISCGVDFRAQNDVALQIADLHNKMTVIQYLLSLGAPIEMCCDTNKAYILFCQRMQEKRRVRAQKKIYFWWIQICYDMSRECGKRMAHLNLKSFEKLMTE